MKSSYKVVWRNWLARGANSLLCDAKAASSILVMTILLALLNALAELTGFREGCAFFSLSTYSQCIG